MVRNLLIGIGIVLVLLVGAVIIVPSLIGTDQMTAFLTERLRGATGYNVSIRGPVALSVLPSPRLSVGDIHVTQTRPDGTELARAASIEVHVALLPLIGGRVEVTAITVRDPVVSLEGPLKDVKPVPQASPAPETGAPETTAATPPTPVGSKFSVAVHHVRVTNGSFAYRDDGKTYQLDHLDFELTTGPDGAVSGSADTGIDGDALHLQGRVGAIDCARPIPLSLHATAAAGAAMLDFDGTARCGGDRPMGADGKVKLAADSLGAALAPFTGDSLPPALDRRLTLDATLGAGPSKADLTELSIDLDRSHGVGSLSARLVDRPSIDLALDFNRLDLDKWLAKPDGAVRAAGAPAPVAATPAPVAVPTAPGPTSARAPPDLHIGLDLSAELLSWRGGLIRQARFNGGIDRGTVTINQATAELPGGTDVSISGQVANAFALPNFVGTVDAETDDLRTVVGWAGLRLGAIPADRLRQASLSTNLDLAAGRAAASGIDLELDGSRFKGAANLMFGNRPAIGLRLVGDQLNLDAYLTDAAPVPVLPVPASPAAPPVANGAGTAVPVVAVAALMPLMAANLDLTFDSVTWRGQLLKAVHFAGTVEDGAANVRDARIGDLGGGGGVGFSGRWAGGLGAAASLSGQMTASGPSAVPLLTLAGLGGRETAGRLGAYRLDLRIDGTPAAFDLDAGVAVQDGHLAAKGRVGLGAGAPHFAGMVTIDHPEAARVLALLAPLYRPARGSLGALALSASLDASPSRAAIDHLSLSIGGLQVDGMATLDQTVQSPRLDADLTASDLVLDPFLPAHEVAAAGTAVRYAALGDPGPLPGRWSHAKLDVSGLGLIDATVKLTAASATIGRWQLDKPSLAFALKGGTLGLDRLSGGLCGGTIEAHGSLGSAPAGPALALTLAARDLDLRDLAQRLGSPVLSGGTGRFDLAVTAAGASQADLIAALGGTASLAARDGTFGGLDLSAINDRLKTLKGPQDLVGMLQAVQGGGTTRFSALTATATVGQGMVRSTDLHLAADGGDLTGSGVVDLPAWTIDAQAQLALAARTDLPPLAMNFSGPLDRPEKRIDVKSLAAYVEQKGLAATPALPSQQQQKPAQQLRDLFKGLISKPNP
ncbi:MAG: hypothetical protein JWO51_2745 [Rhodospirillales bacterium]|nr:hypothetical protein [Rhodospirillales bacterium]